MFTLPKRHRQSRLSQHKGAHMLLKLFSIRDSKGEIYNTPFFNRTAGEAERNFKNLVNDEKSQISKYPEDYDLYYLGEYDDLNGKIKSLDTPSHIAKAVNLKDKSSLQ